MEPTDKVMYKESYVRLRYPLSMLGLVLLIALILGLRSFNAVFYPVLHAEDGTEMLAFYWNHPYPSAIFRFYMGYISLLPNAIGFLSVRLLPLHLAPYAMTLFSLGMAAISLSLFALRRFRPIMPNDRARMLICLILALLPLGNFAMLTNLTYSMWNILIVAILLTASPPPQSAWAKLAQFIFVVLAAWSHPLSVLLIPIGSVLFFIRRSWLDRLINGGIVVSAALYAALGVQAARGFSFSGRTLFVAYQYLMHRVVFEALFGDYVRSELEQTAYAWLIHVLAIVILLMLALAVWMYYKRVRNKADIILAGFLSFVIVALTFLSAVGRSMTLEGIEQPWGHRYFYLQQLLLAFLSILYIVRMLDWTSLSTGARAVMVVLASLYIISLNVCNERYFITSKEQGIGTIAFLKDAEERMYSATAGNEPLVFPRGGEWDIWLLPRSPGD